MLFHLFLISFISAATYVEEGEPCDVPNTSDNPLYDFKYCSTEITHSIEIKFGYLLCEESKKKPFNRICVLKSIQDIAFIYENVILTQMEREDSKQESKIIYDDPKFYEDMIQSTLNDKVLFANGGKSYLNNNLRKILEEMLRIKANTLTMILNRLDVYDINDDDDNIELAFMIEAVSYVFQTVKETCLKLIPKRFKLYLHSVGKNLLNLKSSMFNYLESEKETIKDSFIEARNKVRQEIKDNRALIRITSEPNLWKLNMQGVISSKWLNAYDFIFGGQKRNKISFKNPVDDLPIDPSRVKLPADEYRNEQVELMKQRMQEIMNGVEAAIIDKPDIISQEQELLDLILQEVIEEEVEAAIIDMVNVIDKDINNMEPNLKKSSR